MATSVIEICNNALLDLGEDTIASLTDGSKAARLCNQRWPSVRDAVLRAHPWNCCSAQAGLASLSTAPVWKWTQAYVMPADLLRVVEVVDQGGSRISDWETQGRLIFCDREPPLYVTYVRRETDPQKFDALLGEALAARLSAALAYPLSGSTSLGQTFWNAYREKLAEARGVDAREGTPANIGPTSWIGAKFGG